MTSVKDPLSETLIENIDTLLLSDKSISGPELWEQLCNNGETRILMNLIS